MKLEAAPLCDSRSVDPLLPEFPGFEGAFRLVEAPEGTCLFLFDKDFLGDGYIVDESGNDGSA